MRDLGFLVEEKRSARSELPSRGSIRGIPRFSCQNLVFAVYFLREEARYLLNIRRIPKNPGLPDCEPAHLLVCSPASLLDSAYASIGKRERGANPQLVNEERVELPLDSALARGFLPFIEGEPTLAGAQARTLVRT